MRKKAFTFIELIIAVTIFMIIAASIYSTFNAGLRVWLKTSPMIEENQSFRVFYSTISSDLRGAVAYYEATEALTKPVFGAEYEGKINFEGTPDRISFMAVVGVSSAGSGFHEELARITYLYDKQNKTVKRCVAARSEGLDETKAKAFDMLQDVEAENFGFEYCYKKMISNESYEYEWKDAWEGKNVIKIPRGVRIKAGAFKKTVFIPTGELGEET